MKIFRKFKKLEREMTQKRIRLRKQQITRRRRYKGGTNLTLPFYHYIDINEIARASSFESIICGIQAIDIHTDLLTICGLNRKNQVWFGYQYMKASFYEIHMRNMGITNPDSLVLRKYTLDGFSHKEIKVQEMTEYHIIISV